jgi:hypothetical protein
MAPGAELGAVAAMRALGMRKYDSNLTGSLFQSRSSRTVIAHARNYAVMSANTHKNILRSRTNRRVRYGLFLLHLICFSQIFAATESFSQTRPTFAQQENQCSAARRYCSWGCNARVNNCNLCLIDYSQCMNRISSRTNLVEN